MSDASPMVLNAVAFEEGGLWLAQCLEHNVSEQGGSLTAVYHRLRALVCKHIAEAGHEGVKPFHGFEPAADRFYAMHEDAAQESRTVDLPETGENAHIRLVFRTFRMPAGMAA